MPFADRKFRRHWTSTISCWNWSLWRIWSTWSIWKGVTFNFKLFFFGSHYCRVNILFSLRLRLCKWWRKKQNCKGGYSFSTKAKFLEKLTFLTPYYQKVLTPWYPLISDSLIPRYLVSKANISSFSENFAYLLNE